MIGEKFGKLTVREQVASKNGARQWLCDCDCGGSKIVRAARLRSGDTRSCGCLYDQYDPTPRTIKCIHCKKPKNFPEEFKRRSGKYSDRHYKFCLECSRKNVMKTVNKNKTKYQKQNSKNAKALRQRNMINIVAYLAEHPCVDCGETDWMKLQFDHVRGKKKYQISSGYSSYSWDNLQKEIAKCDVRCANCHQKKTALERGWLRYITNEEHLKLAGIVT
jgi:hypothetical protein